MNPALKWESANAMETAGWLGNNLARARVTGLFQHAGIIPLDKPLFWTLMGPAVLEVLPAMLFQCTGNCVDGFERV